MLKASIVTISLNQGAFLERAIRSVLEQNSTIDLEYIVVDPGSTDGSREIIEKYRTGITKIIFEPDSGPANGLNKGFARASGEMFGYLNADDLLLPGSLRGAAEVLERTGADVVYGDGYFINADGRCVGRCLTPPFSFRRLLLSCVVVMQQSTFFRAQSFFSLGGFNERNHTCWDGELFFEFARRGLRIVHEARYWSAFRLHGGGITGSGRMTTQTLADKKRIFEASDARFGPWLPYLRELAKWEQRLLSPTRSVRLALDRLLGPPNLIL